MTKAERLNRCEGCSLKIPWNAQPLKYQCCFGGLCKDIDVCPMRRGAEDEQFNTGSA